MNIPLVDLNAQYAAIKDEVDAALARVLARSAFIGGEEVRDFERAFAEHCQARHCVGVGNGTDALFLALKALGIGPGHEVIVPAMTFVATAEAVNMAGARPVFADVLPEAYTLDPEDTARKICPATRAIIPVHLYGRPAELPALQALCEKHNLKLIQDAAQAHGASLDGQPLARFGDCACYSFYPGKNLGAYGDAGAVLTDNEELAKLIRKYANHGRAEKYSHDFPGVNSRLDGLQAAVLVVKLKYLDTWIAQRRHAAERYERLLSGIPDLVLPERAPGHAFHLYVIQCLGRDDLRRHLTERGVAAGIHYPTALPFLPAYADLNHQPENFPVAFALQWRILSLPLYPELTAEQSQYIAQAIRAWRTGEARP